MIDDISLSRSRFFFYFFFFYFFSLSPFLSLCLSLSLSLSLSLPLSLPYNWVLYSPGAPPRNVSGEAVSPTSIRVTWEPPPADRSNGRIAYYKLQVVESGRSDSEAKVIKLNDTQFVLDELKKWTEYRIWVLAGTSVGDGPPSYPISVRTHEDGMYHWRSVIFFLSLSLSNVYSSTRFGGGVALEKKFHRDFYLAPESFG